MAIWADRLEKSGVRQSLDASIGILEPFDRLSLSHEDLDHFNRLLKCLKIIKQRLADLDPELATEAALVRLGSILNQVLNQLNAFKQNKNAGHIRSANQLVDQIFDTAALSESTITPTVIKGTIEASASFQAKASEYLQELRASRDELKKVIGTLSNDVAQQKARIEENNTVIGQQKGRLDQSIAEFQKQFSSTEATRAKEHSASLQKNIESFNGEMLKFNQRAEAQLTVDQEKLKAHSDSVNQQGVAFLEWSKQKEDEVKRIFNVIGNVAVAGDYKNTAERECIAANRFRMAALVFMSLLGVVAIVAFSYTIWNHDIDWHLFAFRLATGFILLIPAVYAAQESSKHRERERINRKLHLELSAIDAYLELLPPEKRQEIKGNMTEKFFGLADVAPKDDEVSKHALFDMVKTVVNNVTKGK